MHGAPLFPFPPLVIAAVGAEFPKDVVSLLGSPTYGDVEGGVVASFSFPSEVRDYGVFDDEAFSEMSGRIGEEGGVASMGSS